jgi:DNA-binding CsgD family transcriptional regulator
LERFYTLPPLPPSAPPVAPRHSLLPMEGGALKNSDLLHLVNTLDVAVIHAAPGGQVRWMSNAATRLLAETDDLALENGVLHSRSHRVDIRALLQPGPGQCDGNGSAPAGPPAALLMRRSGQPLPVFVSFMQGRADSHSASCFLFLMDHIGNPAPRSAVLQRLYGLSPAEARFADMFVARCDLRQTATALGVSENTARFTLKIVFRKTGTSKQAQLVRLVMGLPCWERPQ